jgi:hypothetical protein
MAVQAQGTAGPADITAAVAAAKLTGACGVLQSLVNFQTTMRMNGGDAFIVRFVRMEVARLGMTVEDYFSILQAGDRDLRSTGVGAAQLIAPMKTYRGSFFVQFRKTMMGGIGSADTRTSNRPSDATVYDRPA